MSEIVTKIPRGIRNNNPLNIVKGCNWSGLDRDKTSRESRFCVFVDQSSGWRAAALLVIKYYYKYGKKSIAGIVGRWCPDLTAIAYSEFVSKEMGVDVNVDLKLDASPNGLARLRNLLINMACYECGKGNILKWYDFKSMDSAINCARYEINHKYKIEYGE